MGGSLSTDFLSSTNPMLFPSGFAFLLVLLHLLYGNCHNKPALPCQLLSQSSQSSSITGEAQPALPAACPLPRCLWRLSPRTHVNPLSPAQMEHVCQSCSCPMTRKALPSSWSPSTDHPALTHIPPCSSGNRLISCSLTTPLPWLPENRGLYLYF